MFFLGINTTKVLKYFLGKHVKERNARGRSVAKSIKQ